MPSPSVKLRPWASSYVYRRIRSETCLHIDVFAYLITWKGLDHVAIRYQMRRGGRGADPVRELVFLIEYRTIGLAVFTEPKQIRSDHPALVDMYMSDPVLLNGRERRAYADWYTTYHHRHLRDIAMHYPVNDLGCTSRSVRFHYFTAPDHNPSEGFSNWYTAPRARQG